MLDTHIIKKLCQDIETDLRMQTLTELVQGVRLKWGDVA